MSIFSLIKLLSYCLIEDQASYLSQSLISFVYENQHYSFNFSQIYNLDYIPQYFIQYYCHLSKTILKECHNFEIRIFTCLRNVFYVNLLILLISLNKDNITLDSIFPFYSMHTIRKFLN